MSVIEIGAFGLLYSDDIRTCSFPSCVEIEVEFMEVFIFLGLCTIYFRISIAVLLFGGDLGLIRRS